MADMQQFQYIRGNAKHNVTIYRVNSTYHHELWSIFEEDSGKPRAQRIDEERTYPYDFWSVITKHRNPSHELQYLMTVFMPADRYGVVIYPIFANNPPDVPLDEWSRETEYPGHMFHNSRISVLFDALVELKYLERLRPKTETEAIWIGIDKATWVWLDPAAFEHVHHGNGDVWAILVRNYGKLLEPAKEYDNVEGFSSDGGVTGKTSLGGPREISLNTDGTR